MAFRSSSFNASLTGGSTSGTVPVPSGAASGDIAIIAISLDYFGSETITWPSGFTEVQNYANLGVPDGNIFGIAWKRLTGADSGTYAISWTSSADWLIECALFSGRDATNPPVSNIATNTSANTSPVSVAATGVTAVAGDDLLWIGAVDQTGNGAASCSPPSTFTEQQDAQSTDPGGAAGGYCNVSMATKDNVSAGATGTITGTYTTSATAGWAASLVRIPAAASTGIPNKIYQTNFAVKRASYY